MQTNSALKVLIAFVLKIDIVLTIGLTLLFDLWTFVQFARYKADWFRFSNAEVISPSETFYLGDDLR